MIRPFCDTNILAYFFATMKSFEILKGAMVTPSEHELDDLRRRTVLTTDGWTRPAPLGSRNGDTGTIVGPDPASRMKVLVDWGGVVKSHRLASVSRIY